MRTQQQRDLAAALLRSAEQPLAPFKEHSPSEVKQVALMLYAQRPFTLSNSNNSIQSESDFDLLVTQAFDFLDNLDMAYAKVGKARSQSGRNLPQGGILIARQGETIVLGKAEKELPLNASGNVLFNAAVKYITCEKHRKVKSSKTKFETVVRGDARALGHAEQETDALLAHWEKNGMPLNEVKWWCVLYNGEAYRHYRIAERAKKRKPRTKERRESTIGQKIKEWSPEEKTGFREIAEAQLAESAAKKEKKKKLNALRKAVQTGEIE